MELIDLRKVFPNLEGFIIHVHRHDPDQLRRSLEDLNFRVILIDGERVHDEATFFDEFADALRFPDYFGHNWDAWTECLYDFGYDLDTDRFALIWVNAEYLLKNDPQTFLNAVCDLRDLALTVTHVENTNSKKAHQFEIFLHGQWK